MDSGEFTNQLVQFSQVEQQINTNKKLDSLVQLQLSNFLGSSLGYVGLDIHYLSSELNFDGENPVNISYALEGSATDSQIFIMDEAGEIVYSGIAEKEAGAHEFVWDGTNSEGFALESGTYEVRVDALDHDGELIETSTVVSGRVKGVESQSGTLYLIVGERAVPLGNVLKAQEPLTVAETEEAGNEDEGSGTEEEEAA